MLRSTLGRNLVNELRYGISYAPVWFADEVELSQFDDQGGLQYRVPQRGRGPDQRHDQCGAHLAATARAGTSTTPSTGCAASTRSSSAPRSRGSAAGRRRRRWCQRSILGVDTTNDPANADVHNDVLSECRRRGPDQCARAVWLLTGRVTSIESNARLDGSTGQYVYLGTGGTDEQQDEVGLFIQDSWRIRPNLTVNGGLRWQVAMPFQANTSVYSMDTMADLCGVSGLGDGPGGRECNLFNPGVFNQGGRPPVYELYNAGTPGYNTEYDNFAPNVGVAWQPDVRDRLAPHHSW